MTKEIGSPSTVETFAASPQKITFEHTINDGGGRRSRGVGLLCGVGKPFIAMTVLFLLVAAAASYFLNGWLRIPDLNREIDRLENQVNLLNIEVNRFQEENNRYEELNDELNTTVAELTNLTDSLNTTVIELNRVSDDLNNTNYELSQRVTDLTIQNDNYSELNQVLNNTADNLSAEVVVLQEAVHQLNVENDVLSNLTDVLSDTRDSLTNITMEQNETLLELQNTLDTFIVEYESLRQVNNNLTQVVMFLNDTSVGLGNSLDEITVFLAQQITTNQVLVMAQLEDTYRNKVANWDCDYRLEFFEKPYGGNYFIPITEEEDRNSVLEYVDQRILSELCLDKVNFDTYLNHTYTDHITSHRVISGINDFTHQAIDFYFPEQGETGLSYEDWSGASFDCENFEAENMFVWSS